MLLDHVTSLSGRDQESCLHYSNTGNVYLLKESQNLIFGTDASNKYCVIGSILQYGHVI